MSECSNLAAWTMCLGTPMSSKTPKIQECKTLGNAEAISRSMNPGNSRPRWQAHSKTQDSNSTTLSIRFRFLMNPRWHSATEYLAWVWNGPARAEEMSLLSVLLR
eukprot:431291-Pyramimonas_sp.AAC.1